MKLAVKNKTLFGLNSRDRVSSFPGLFLADRQFGLHEDDLKAQKVWTKKKNQQQDFEKAIITSSYVKFLAVVGSNNIKDQIVKKCKLVPLHIWAVKTWNNLSLNKQIFFNPKVTRLFPKSSETFIKEKTFKFMDRLVEIFKRSGALEVFISSILERVYKSKLKHSEIYTALINYYVQYYITEKLQSCDVCNKNGEKIKFVFVDVRGQYF